MAKIRLWDVKDSKSGSVASPSTDAPARATGRTPTAADYFNSPLANPSRKASSTSQPDGLKISGFSSNSRPITQDVQQDAKLSSQEDISYEAVQRFKVLKKKQRRRQSMSVAVSEEEEEMLRIGAAKEGMTFSAWARKHLFRAMKEKIPRRPNEG